MNTLFALCAVGAERILGNEIKKLGYTLQGNLPGRVMFTADDDGLFRANLCLRTADRVYLQVATYKADNFDDLFEGVYAVDWHNYFHKDVKITVDKVRSYRSKLNSEHTVQAMTHKALYQKLGDTWHISVLPESGQECAIRIYIEENTVHILLDLSGLPLHKRGYRTDGGIAPLRETTAATLLHFMLWRRKLPLHDPFCGSGTIPIEATLFAHNVAPGFGRKFALEHLAFYNAKRAEEIRCAEAEKIRTDVEVRITGTDKDPSAIERARRNAEHACVMAGRALQSIRSDAHIPRPEFAVADFTDIKAPYPEGLILCNPPYGERLGDDAQAQALYKQMACLFTDFPAWEFGIITSHKHFQECVGRYASLLKNIKSGNLDTTFYMYQNTSKAK